MVRFVMVSTRLGYIEADLSGSELDEEHEVDISRLSAGGAVVVRDFGATLIGGTATEITARLRAISGSARAEELVELDAGTAERPTLYGAYLAHGGALWIELEPDAAHASNHATAKAWIEVPI